MGAGETENTKGLGPRQQKSFATARARLETETMTRIAWMKDHHGLGMNRANRVMSVAFPTGSGWGRERSDDRFQPIGTCSGEAWR